MLIYLYLISHALIEIQLAQLFIINCWLLLDFYIRINLIVVAMNSLPVKKKNYDICHYLIKYEI